MKKTKTKEYQETKRIKALRLRRKRMSKKENGITLIALVVTIIILLILAGVTLKLVLDNNGLIGRSKEGAEIYAKSGAQEEIEMALSSIQAKYYDNIIGKISIKEDEFMSDINEWNNALGTVGEVTELVTTFNGEYIIKYKQKKQDNEYSFKIDKIGNIEICNLETLIVNSETELINALNEGNCIIKLQSDIGINNTLNITSNNIIIQSNDNVRKKIYALNNFVAVNNRMIIIGDGNNETKISIHNIDLIADANNDNKYAVFLINSGSQLGIYDSQVTGGYTANVTHGAGGMSFGKLAMDNVEVHDNYGYRCGGIYTQAGGETYIKNCLIHDNAISLDYAGGLYVNTTGKLTVEDSKIYNNNAQRGSAIFTAGYVTLSNVEVYNNSPGVAVYKTDWGGNPTLTINNCDFHDNSQDVYPAN